MEVYKATYESWNDKLWNDCSGVMIWMSNPCWPSLAWNTYDYYLEPTAAYFGCKKACEPIHIQWSAASNDVKVVNCTLKALKGIHAEARVYCLDGALHHKKAMTLDCAANAATPCFNLFEGRDAKASSLSDVYFIRLELTGPDGRLLSDNFYWNGKETWKYEALAAMKKAAVTAAVSTAQAGDVCKVSVKLANASSVVALMIRVKLLDPATGLLVAPILYSDNYISLAPGESRTIEAEYRASKLAGKDVKVLLEGWNVAEADLSAKKA
jgi:hypothetical protein